MFKPFLSPLLMAACGAFALTGCSTTVAVRGPVPPPVVVYRDRPAPPPLIVEEQPVPPPYRVVWIHGHWSWDGHRYVWHHGHYRAV